MKSMDLIRGEIEALCQRHRTTISETLLTALTAYVTHEIVDARQDVFNMVADQLNKRG